MGGQVLDWRKILSQIYQAAHKGGWQKGLTKKAALGFYD
jgi:hypothetical protein